MVPYLPNRSEAERNINDLHNAQYGQKIKFLDERPLRRLFLKQVDEEIYWGFGCAHTFTLTYPTALGEIRYAMHRAVEALKPSRKEVEA